LALDGQGRLYVADFGNHRVLEFDPPLSSGMAANRVFGQNGSFTTGLPNKGGISANSLFNPTGLTLDTQGRLYVADQTNNRVLEYDAPLVSQTANHVIGQPSFLTNTENTGGISALSLNAPYALALDTDGNLYVSDNLNDRVLEYDNPLATNTAADFVIGQPNFSTDSAHTGQVSASSLNGPTGLAFDRWGNLYVVDYWDSRVLEYDPPLTHDAIADHVFGQPNFTRFLAYNRAVGADSLAYPTFVAVDDEDNLYVTDYNNNRVLEYDWARGRLFLPLARR